MQIDLIPETDLSAADEAEIARLLARCFTTDFGGRSFFQQRHHLRLVLRAPGIVSHIALGYRAVRLDGQLIDVLGIAEVATAPERRGQGLAAHLLDAAIAAAKGTRAEFLILFGTAALYAGRGFATVSNPLRHVAMTGAVTGEAVTEPAEHLMVLPLGDLPWQEGVLLDLLGPKP